MIIQFIEFTNIFRYCNTQRFEFPHEGASNLTVILGRNNAGKSTLIKGLKFLLYGVGSYGLTRDEIQSCVNREAIRQVKAGCPVTMSVKTKFITGKLTYTVTRLLKVNRKSANGFEVEVGEQSVHLKSHHGSCDIPSTDLQVVNRILQGAVPPALFDFYFFQGEDVANELLKPHVNQDMSKALLDVFYKSDWDRAIEDLVVAKGEFANKRRIAAGENSKLKKLSDDKDLLLEMKSNLSGRLAQQVTFREEWQRKYDEADQRFLKTYDNEKEKQGIEHLKFRKDSCERHVAEQLEELQATIGKDGYLAFLVPALDPAKKLLGDLRSQGRLPPDVTAELVNRLLEEGICICKTCLADNGAARKTLEKLKADCMSEKSGRALASLYDAVAYPQSGFAARISSVGASIKSRRDKYNTDGLELTQVTQQLKDAESNYNPQAHVAREKWKQQRAAALDEVTKSRTAELRLDNELRECTKRLEDIIHQLGRVRGVPEEARKWQGCEEMADKMILYVRQFEVNMLKYCHRLLKKMTSEMYSETVTDGSTAWIDPNTLLPKIQYGTMSGGAYGGGQRQVIILSYICALSELRKEVCKKMRDLFGVNLVNEQCFFMDCVFGNMEPKYQASITQSLHSRIKQLVLLFHPTQWNETIQEELDGHIHKAYALMNSVTRDEKNEFQVVGFYGKDIKLSCSQKADTESVTTVHQIK